MLERVTGQPTSTTPPGPPPRRKVPQRAPRPDGSHDHIETLDDRATVSTWIFALLACCLIALAFAVARDHLLGEQPTTPEEVEVAEAGAKKPAKVAKKKTKRARTGTAARTAENYDDFDWEADLADNGMVVGDILDRVQPEAPDEPAREAPPYEPTRDEHQPTGTYRPVAAWSEPGANDDATVLDFSAKSASAPLSAEQVKSVLDARKVAPCYDPWVQKIPQMQGRMHLDFVVAADGHVAAVRVTRSDLRSRVVEACVVQRARQLRFPRSAGGKTKFSTHFDFTNR